MISIVGGVTIAMRAAHHRRLIDNNIDKEKKRLARQLGRNKFVEIDGNNIYQNSLIAANRVRSEHAEKAKRELLAYVSKKPTATITELGKSIGKSRPTTSAYIKELIKSGKLKRDNNGNLLEVI